MDLPAPDEPIIVVIFPSGIWHVISDNIVMLLILDDKLLIENKILLKLVQTLTLLPK